MRKMKILMLALMVFALACPIGFAKGPEDPLTQAAAVGDLKKVKDLVAAGASVNGLGGKGPKNDWPLLAAARGGHTEVIRFLIKEGAWIDQQMYGMPNRTALMVAAEAGHKSTVEILLKFGANPLLRGSMGRTALELAQKYQHDSVVKLLQGVTFTDLTKEDVEQVSLQMGILSYFLDNPGQDYPQDYDAKAMLRQKLSGSWGKPTDEQMAHLMAGLKMRAKQLKKTFPSGWKFYTSPSTIYEENKARVLGRLYIVSTDQGILEFKQIEFERVKDGNWMMVDSLTQKGGWYELYQRLLSDDQKIRAAAIKELPKVIAEMDIQNLALMISALIQETGQIGTKDDSAPQNSWKAQEALLAIGTPALPYLLETLKIQVEYPPIKPGWVYVLVRDNVARLLGQFKPPVTKAVALLVEEVKKTKSANAAEALGQIGVSSPQVINTLQELLKDYTWPESTYVIVAAVKALHQLGVKPLPTAEIVKKLSAQLKGEGLLPSEHRIYAQMEAAHALLSLNPDNKEAVEILIEGMEKTTDSGVFSIIEQIGPPAKDVVPKLIEKLKGYYPIPVMAALKSIGTPEALKAVNEYVRAGHSINILDNNQKNELQNSEIKKQYIVTVKGVSTTSTARASYNFSFHIESPNKEEFTSVSVGLYDTDEQLLNELAVEWDEESLVHRVATSFRKDKRYRMSIIPGDYKCENVVLESEDKEFHWTTYGRKPCPQISYEKYDLLAVLADKTLPIQATYLSKIVYTRDNDFNQDVLIKDCQKRGGVFNECGTICNDQSKEWPCPTPTGCAFTCEFKGEKK